MTALADILPLNLADIFFSESHPLRGQPGVVLAFIIRHADGPILYDTGMGTGHEVIERLYRPVVRSLEPALEEHGLRPQDIVAVANSHLYFDHCGGNRFFAGVPVYVQAADYTAAHETTFTILGCTSVTTPLSGTGAEAPRRAVLARPRLVV